MRQFGMAVALGLISVGCATPSAHEDPASGRRNIGSAASPMPVIYERSKVCVSVQIDPRLDPAPDITPANLSRWFAIELFNMLARAGVSNHIDNGPELRFTNDERRGDPTCSDGTDDILVTVTYGPRADGSPFAFSYRIEQGSVVRSVTEDFDVAEAIRAGRIAGYTLRRHLFAVILDDLRQRARQLATQIEVRLPARRETLVSEDSNLCVVASAPPQLWQQPTQTDHVRDLTSSFASALASAYGARDDVGRIGATSQGPRIVENFDFARPECRDFDTDVQISVGFALRLDATPFVVIYRIRRGTSVYTGVMDIDVAEEIRAGRMRGYSQRRTNATFIDESMPRVAFEIAGLLRPDPNGDEAALARSNATSTYEREETEILRAFLNDQLERPRTQPPCVSPILTPPESTVRLALTQIRAPRAESFDRDARILVRRPGQIPTGTRTLTLREIQQLFPGSRAASESECSSTFHLSRPFVYPRIAFLSAVVNGPCIYAEWRASFERRRQGWRTKFSDAHSTVGGLPGCGTRAATHTGTDPVYFIVAR